VRACCCATAEGDFTLPLPTADFGYTVEAAAGGGSRSYSRCRLGRSPVADGVAATAAAQDNPGHLLYGAYLGGSSDDRTLVSRWNGSGVAYVTGYTYSTDFPSRRAPSISPTTAWATPSWSR